MWSELDVSTALTDLLVKLIANSTIDVVQVLVCQADLSNRAIRVEVCIVDDSGILQVHVLLIRRLLLVKIAIELIDLLNEFFVVDHSLLALLLHSSFVLKELTVSGVSTGFLGRLD